MVARVKSNGSPVWYLTAKDEGHGFRKKSNADFQFYATVLFVRQHPLGVSEPQTSAIVPMGGAAQPDFTVAPPTRRPVASIARL